MIDAYGRSRIVQEPRVHEIGVGLLFDVMAINHADNVPPTRGSFGVAQ